MTAALKRPDKRREPKRMVTFRSKKYSFAELMQITGKTKNVILGWERRGIFDFMLNQYLGEI